MWTRRQRQMCIRDRLRTAGESRISNFLLYQITYTELLFIEDLWPDINADILDDVLLEFNSRNRTYGKN